MVKSHDVIFYLIFFFFFFFFFGFLISFLLRTNGHIVLLKIVGPILVCSIAKSFKTLKGRGNFTNEKEGGGALWPLRLFWLVEVGRG